MTIHEFLRVLRARWLTVCITIILATLAAITFSLITTPLYQASTRLFVSASGGTSAAEVYQGNRYSQERVISYAELLVGETLAQRTIDKLGLDMSGSELQGRIKANAKLDTVLINVTVLDESPVRARDIANALSDEFVVMVRELETPEGAVNPEARVVVEQRASVPAEPVVPKVQRNIAAGLAIGLAMGVGLAIVRDLLDNTTKSREVVEQITGSGLVGSVPLDKDRRKVPAISFENESSSIAESFRKIRTNLQFLAVDNPPRVILVGSSMPAEGKTTTAINIALALAEADHDVLLIDGDMRRPMLHKHLDLIGTVGFSNVLSGSATLDEALQKAQVSGLTVLTCGAVPPNPSELLGSMAAKTLLDDTRSRFDYVIVDTTPLLAVTDAAVLAAKSDGVLLIARYGRTKRDQLVHAVGSLESVGAKVLGTVLTMIPTRGGSSQYYGYSYYGSDKAPDSR